ncbi:MAG: TetR family transcriptional regulator C-terminal domain-containing protein [Rhodobacteraceae bacterium]|nr:TetR family transcriptional regulator C-terminal domain-containing protein [Paracoccaceae bacterium]
MKQTRKSRAEIRQAILDAAISEFAREGLEGTSTQTLAKAAGITKAQLHYYISSKEELYEDTLLHIVELWKGLFFFSADPGDPAREIADYIARKVHHAIEFPDASRLFAREVARGAPVLRQHWAGLQDNVNLASGVIEGWIAQGQIQPVHPVMFQMNIWAVTQHYAEYEAQARFLLGTPDDEKLDPGPIIAEVTELFLRRCGLQPIPDEASS